MVHERLIKLPNLKYTQDCGENSRLTICENKALPNRATFSIANEANGR